MSKFKVGDRVKYKSWCDHIVVGNVEKVYGTGTYEVNGVYVEEQQLTKVDSPLDPYIRSFLAYSLKLPKWDLEIHSYGDKRYEIDKTSRTEIVRLYNDYKETEHSKIFKTDILGRIISIKYFLHLLYVRFLWDFLPGKF